MSDYEQYIKQLYNPFRSESEEEKLKYWEKYKNYIKNQNNKFNSNYITDIFLPDRYIEKMEINVFPHFPFSPPDYHTQNFLMITYICCGEFINIVEGEKVIMREGDVCIMAPSTYRSFDCTSKDFKEICHATAFHIFVHPNAIEKMFKDVANGNDEFSNFIKSIFSETQHSNYAHFKCNDNSVSLRLGELLWYEMRDSLDENAVTNSNIGNAIFKAFLAEISSKKRYRIFFSKKRNRANTTDIITYINNHFRTITLKQLSEQFNYSHCYLSRVIKHRVGKNFLEYVTELRLKHALQLLNDEDLSIRSISEECGYNNVEHFLRMFKNHYGITPTEYRKSYKNT